MQLATTDKLRPYIQSEPIIVQKEKSPADDLSSRVVTILLNSVLIQLPGFPPFIQRGTIFVDPACGE